MFSPVSHRGKLSRTESAVEGGGDLSDREEAAGVEDVVVSPRLVLSELLQAEGTSQPRL